MDTRTRPVQKQWKGTWAFKDSTVFFSNQFDGARLNGVAHDSLNFYTLLIAAENVPINPSPWYAFKVWSTDKQAINVRLTYENSRNRYYPKISDDGINFYPADSSQVTYINKGEGKFGMSAAPEKIDIALSISENPKFISAQELYPSKRVFKWMDSLAQNTYIKQSVIGKSRENRPLKLLTINETENTKAVLVMTRQHPPEVTGFLAMKSFLETLAGPSKLASDFRKEFTIYAVPHVNPDGVDNGHWRHARC